MAYWHGTQYDKARKGKVEENDRDTGRKMPWVLLYKLSIALKQCFIKLFTHIKIYV